MSRYWITRIVVGLLLLAGLAWAVSVALERLVTPQPQLERTTTATATPESGVPRITATLFYASADGQALTPVRREVALAEGVVPQGRQILIAQLEPAPSPYVSVIPPGTMLRAFYVTERGDAFVDVSADVALKHPGGSFTELLTVNAIVSAITSNLPSIERVQILIEGKEADTLAGHVDLRRPLQPNPSLVREEAEAR